MKKRLITILLMSVILFGMLTSCETDTASPENKTTESDLTVTTTSPEEADNGLLHVVKNGESLMPVVYPATAGNEVKALAGTLRSRIDSLTEADTRFITDYLQNPEDASAETPEILVGSTNRSESQQLLSELEGLSFAVKITKTKVVIVGSNNRMLSDAVDWFLANYLPRANIGIFDLKPDTLYVSTPADNTIGNIMEAEKNYTASPVTLGDIESQGDFGVVAGGCVYGDFYYMILRTATFFGDIGSYAGVVCKYSLPDMALVGTSQPMIFDSGADMTYDPESDRIVIAHGKPAAEKVSYITAGDMNLAYSKEADTELSAITALGDGRFAAIENDSGSLVYLDKQLKVTKREELNTTLTGTVNSCTSDNRFIYLLGSRGDSGYVTVLTLDGVYVNRIALTFTSLESVNISLTGSGFAVGYRSSTRSGGTVYKVDIS